MSKYGILKNGAYSVFMTFSAPIEKGRRFATVGWIESVDSEQTWNAYASDIVTGIATADEAAQITKDWATKHYNL